MKLFVSHSSDDVKFVELLVDLLRNALNLPTTGIRCTSLDGYKLPGGADIMGQLRQEVADAQVFVALISDSSLKSVYTLFELGARWGTTKPLIPLLAPGLSAQILPPPLNNFNALATDSRPQLYQLISDVAQKLGSNTEDLGSFEKYVHRILEFASTLPSEPPASALNPRTIQTPTPPTPAYSSEETIRSYCEQQWPSDYQMQSYCRKQQREALAKLQSLQVGDIPIDTFSEIRQSCAAQWPDDFTMRLYCERQQLEAYRELQRENST
jgi:TIR domain